MNSRKTIPLLLLTLAAYSPCGRAISAAASTAPTSGDMEINPASTPASSSIGYDYQDSPTVTPFFTPAVMMPNYYTRPQPAHKEPSDEGAPVDLETVDVDAAPEPSALPEATETSSPADSLVDPPAPTAYQVVDMPGMTASSSILIESLPTESSSSLEPIAASNTGDATLVVTVSSSTYSFSVPTSHVTFIPASSTSHSASYTVVQPTSHPKSTQSSETQLTRKAAIIGTLLAVASLLGLSVCAVCTRCRLPRGVCKASGGDDHTGRRSDDSDLEKALHREGSRTQSGTTYQLPSLAIHEPIPTPEATPSPEPNEYGTPGQKHAEGQLTEATEGAVSLDFEDVTHVLSEDAFASPSGSERCSPASADSETPILNRASNGAASMQAESYATRESCYSMPSTRASRAASEGAVSTEYLSMEPSSRSPSPPESPVLRTPKQPEICTVTRTRSKTLTQPSSPRVDSTVSSSKSFPVRLAGRMGDVVDGEIDESEWDIAAAYGRFSKASTVGGPPTVEEMHEQEHMETVDIGGRNCILVTGYAF